MTLSDFQRGLLAEFAFRQAGPGASLEMMQAIAMVIRNRVRKGWHDGNWTRAIEGADEHNAHEYVHVEIDPDNRTFQLLLRAIDDIYYGQDWGTTGDPGAGMNMEDSIVEEGHEKLYWAFTNRKIRPWFKEKILDDRKNHRSRTQMGLMMFLE